MQNGNAGIHQRARKIVFPQPTSLRSLTSCCPGRSFPCFLTNPAALRVPPPFFFLPSGVGGTAYISYLWLSFKISVQGATMAPTGALTVASPRVSRVEKTGMKFTRCHVNQGGPDTSGLVSVPHKSRTPTRPGLRHPRRVCAPQHYALLPAGSEVSQQKYSQQKYSPSQSLPCFWVILWCSWKALREKLWLFHLAKLTPQCGRVSLTSHRAYANSFPDISDNEVHI